MIWVILGTRPEMIKLAPVIQELKENNLQNKIILTGQHSSITNEIKHFNITADTNLHIKTHNLNSIVTEIMRGLSHYESKEDKPDCVIVQGDTTSAMAAALWAFNNKIPVAHVEAGLRTYMGTPYPEEANRRMITCVTTYHYAPTKRALRNLVSEGVLGENRLQMVGNTVIDAMNTFAPHKFTWKIPTILVTLHRRENWGQPMIDTLKGLIEWLDTTDMQAVWPVHPNVISQGVSREFNHERLLKVEPYEYRNFIPAMRGARFLLTDSGGIQEEATALGKYTIVVRHNTERPEVLIQGTAKLVPPERVAVRKALENAEAGWGNLKPSDVFGDGHAAKRIVEHLIQNLRIT